MIRRIAVPTVTSSTPADTTRPTVTIEQTGSDPSSSSSIPFAVVFSEPVTGFTNADVSLSGTAGGTLSASVSGSGASYTVTVTGMSTDGTVIASIPANVAQDAAGNLNEASTSSDNTVTWTAPVGGSRVLLTPSNFQLVGHYATPYDSRYFFTRGRMTARTVAGQPRLLFQGTENYADINATHVLECSIPLDGSGNPVTGHNALTEVYDWGDVTYGNRLTEAPGTIAMLANGLVWDEDAQLLHVNDIHWYGTPAHQNPSVFSVSLNGGGTTTLYGPWRGSIIDWSCAAGSMMIVPTWFQTAYGAKRIAVHGGRIVQFSHAGMCLFAYDPPATGSQRDTPYDWSTGDTSRNATNTFAWQSLVHHPGNAATSPDSTAHPQAIPGAAKYICEGGCPHPIVPGPGGIGQCSPGCTVDTPFLIAPYWNGVNTDMTGAPSFVTYADLVGGTLDTWSASGWIDTGTHHGILSFGFLQSSGHGWYGSYVRDPGSSSCQLNTFTCFHGLSQVTGGQGTGMCATQVQNQFEIRDPMNLANVIGGSADPWDFAPDYFDTTDNFGDTSDWDFSYVAGPGGSTGAGTRTTDYFGPGSAQSFGAVVPLEINGDWYVFISQNGYYIDGGNARSTVHCFKIVT